MTQDTLTVPAKPLVEVRVTTFVFWVVAPEVKESDGVCGLRVKEGAVRVTAMVEEVTTVVPLVPVTVTLRVPAVPTVVLTVSTVEPEPPEVRASEVGERLHVPAAVPLAVVTVQVRATVPTKLFTDLRAMESVLPVVAPEINEIAVEVGMTVKVGVLPAVTVTVMTDEVTTVDPLVPVTVTVKTPAAVVVRLSVEVPVPPEVRVLEVGERAQVPLVPLTLVTAQVRATVPVKPPVDVVVMTSVLPVVAPAKKANEVDVGTTVKDGVAEAVTVTTMLAEVILTLSGVELVPAAVTVTSNTPEVPAVGLMVRVSTAEVPEPSVTELAESEHVPAAVPLTFVTLQVRAGLPTNELTEVTVMTSVLPEVAPAASV